MREYDSRTLLASERIAVLERDRCVCQYCGGDADQVDHIIPWSHSHSNAIFNLVSSCCLCNSVASNKIFDTFLEKKNHILTRRLQMLSRRAVPIWFKNEIDELAGRLKEKIVADCIVVENWKEGLHTAMRLAQDGFRVTFGYGDEMGVDELVAESKRVENVRTRKGNVIKNKIDGKTQPCSYCGKLFPLTRKTPQTKKYCFERCRAKAAEQRKMARLALDSK